MEQHIIPFNQGIHLTPSAAEDGQLSDCINLIPKDGTLRNVPQLEQISNVTLATGHTLAFVHEPQTGTTNYITQKEIEVEEGGVTVTKTALFQYGKETAILTLDTDIDINQITSVGNTIIVLASDGMHYLLWKRDETSQDPNAFKYEYLGTHMPEPKMNFSLEYIPNLDPQDNDIPLSRKKDIDPDFDPLTLYHEDNRATPESTPTKAHNIIGFEDGYQKPFNDAIYGEVNRLLNEEVTKKGYFGNPFYVRYAYRLYDGSLVMHSAPIYMDNVFEISVVSDHENGNLESSNPDVYEYWGTSLQKLNIHIVKHIGDSKTYPNGTKEDDPELDQDLWWNFNIKRFKLKYSIVDRTGEITNIQKWSDIIKSIDIFISQPFYLYDQGGTIEKVHHEIDETGGNHKQWVYVDLPKVEHQDELINDCGQFYFTKSIYVNEMDGNTHDLDVKGYLEALTSREQMSDDYDSHDSLIPRYSFPYNQRLNIANITKGLFSGFNADLFCLPAGSDSIRMSVTYHTPQKDISFRLNKITESISLPLVWHYYIPSQYPVTIKIVATINSTNLVKQRVELSSHSFLNGYYAPILREGFEAVTDTNFDTLVDNFLDATSSDIKISLPNKIYTSEINNPFFFPVSGINTVGVGEIKGICAAVKALSTGQFGQFPLYVFTTDGIWALEVASDGTYSVKQPVTRDVVSNDNSITQTDTAVLYVTKRGLHIIYGSETKLLTEALEAYTEDSLFTTTSEQGKINIDTTTAGFPEITSSVLATVSLLSQLQTCSISYDGINHIAHIYPAPSQTQPSTHYILNLDTMEWTRTTQPIPDAFIDGYPNATLQINEEQTEEETTITVGKLYQYELPTYSSTNTQQGFLLTRETALGAPLTHKILHDMRIIKHFYSATFTRAKVRIIPLISNDRRNWYQLTSIKGHSSIWYRFAIFTNMADADIIEALTLITAPRRTNKLR